MICERASTTGIEKKGLMRGARQRSQHVSQICFNSPNSTPCTTSHTCMYHIWAVCPSVCGSRAALHIQGSTIDQWQYYGSRTVLQIKGGTTDQGQYKRSRAVLQIQGSFTDSGHYNRSRAVLQIKVSATDQGQYYRSRAVLVGQYSLPVLNPG